MKIKTFMQQVARDKKQRSLGYEKPTNKPSMTVPDQSMSISEILQRYRSGLPINGNMHVPIYHGEDEFYPNPATLDLADQQRMREEAAEELQAIKDKLDEKARKAKEAKAKKFVQTEIPDSPSDGDNPAPSAGTEENHQNITTQ